MFLRQPARPSLFKLHAALTCDENNHPVVSVHECRIKHYPLGRSKEANWTLQFATLRLRGRPGRDGCQNALWDCLGGQICRHVQNASPKQSHNALDNHLDPIFRATSKWRIAHVLFSRENSNTIPRLSGNFLYLVFGFLYDQVSSRNCETMRS